MDEHLLSLTTESNERGGAACTRGAIATGHTMTGTDWCAEHLVQKIRRFLALAAHGRPSLTATLQRSFSCANLMARLTVTDIFGESEDKGLMCHIDVKGLTGEPVLVVAPITQLAFNRRHPDARDIAAYRKRRAESAAVNDLGDK